MTSLHSLFRHRHVSSADYQIPVISGCINGVHGFRSESRQFMTGSIVAFAVRMSGPAPTLAAWMAKPMIGDVFYGVDRAYDREALSARHDVTSRYALMDAIRDMIVRLRKSGGIPDLLVVHAEAAVDDDCGLTVHRDAQCQKDTLYVLMRGTWTVLTGCDGVERLACNAPGWNGVVTYR